MSRIVFFFLIFFAAHAVQAQEIAKNVVAKTPKEIQVTSGKPVNCIADPLMNTMANDYFLVLRDTDPAKVNAILQKTIVSRQRKGENFNVIGPLAKVCSDKGLLLKAPFAAKGTRIDLVELLKPILEGEIIKLDIVTGDKAPPVSCMLTGGAAVQAAEVKPKVAGNTSLDLMGPFLEGDKDMDDPCTTCSTGGELIYDFAANSVQYDGHSVDDWFHLPKVGDSLIFRVTNLNPFRDSVIISSSTFNYNNDSTEISFINGLFSFTPPTGIPANGALLTIDGVKIEDFIADVEALGKQIKEIRFQLRDYRDCKKICDNVKIVYKAAIAYFDKRYQSYNTSEQTLEGFLVPNINLITDADQRNALLQDVAEWHMFRTIRTDYAYKVPKLQNADEYIFNLTIQNQAGVTTHAVVDHQDIHLPLLGGIKADASAGLFVSRLMDDHYNLVGDSSVILNSYGGDSLVYNKRNKVVKDQNGKYDFGVAALLHFYPRLSRVVNVGLSIGAGLSLHPSPSLRYLSGVSLLIGMKNRLALTWGAAAGFVDRLSDRYAGQTTATGIYTAAAETSVTMKKMLRCEQFVSLSYNIALFPRHVNATSASPAPSTPAATATPAATPADATKAAKGGGKN